MFGMGIPKPKLFSYGILVNKIDVWEVDAVNDSLCHDLLPDELVDGGTGTDLHQWWSCFCFLCHKVSFIYMRGN